MKKVLAAAAAFAIAAALTLPQTASAYTYVKPYYKPSTGTWVSGHFRR
jgi:hypothetical protein